MKLVLWCDCGAELVMGEVWRDGKSLKCHQCGAVWDVELVKVSAPRKRGVWKLGLASTKG